VDDFYILLISILTHKQYDFFEHKLDKMESVKSIAIYFLLGDFPSNYYLEDKG